MWYVVCTKEGKEEQLLNFIKYKINKKSYEDFLFIKKESLKRLGGEWVIQVQPLYSGYIFLKTQTPQLFNLFLENAKIGHILNIKETNFLPINIEEEKLLLLAKESENNILQLTKITLAENGEVLSFEGLLNSFSENITRLNLRKRYALVDIKIAGQKKSFLFGIRLEKDRISI